LIDQVQHISIIGAGESGTGAALLAKAKGYAVFVSDAGSMQGAYKQELQEAHLSFEENHHSANKILQSDLVIKSPGIPDDAPMIQEINNTGIPIISEIEFASYFTSGYKIGITGTNGKTTTAALTYDMLQNAGLDVALAGNIGQSFSRKLEKRDYRYWVLEISSFQLDHLYKYKNDIAVLLTITADHLDRYGNNFQHYVDSKFRITLNQSNHDYFIYNYDDPAIMENLPDHELTSRMLPISVNAGLDEGAYIQDDQIHVKIDKQETEMTLEKDDLALYGTHNKYNSMAATVIGRALELRKTVIRDSLSNFQTIEHRLEKVMQIRGVEFVNDSKATNINAAWYALESMDKPIIWIAGGQDKGNDYSSLLPVIQDKVKAIVCLGIDNEKINNAFKGEIFDIYNSQNVNETVELAYKLASNGDVVLLAPGCASFDLFENYEDRGRQFKKAIKEL